MQGKAKANIFYNFLHLIQNVVGSVIIFLSMSDCFHNLGLNPVKDLFFNPENVIWPLSAILSFKNSSLPHMPR